MEMGEGFGWVMPVDMARRRGMQMCMFAALDGTRAFPMLALMRAGPADGCCAI